MGKVDFWGQPLIVSTLNYPITFVERFDFTAMFRHVPPLVHSLYAP